MAGGAGLGKYTTVKLVCGGRWPFYNGNDSY